LSAIAVGTVQPVLPTRALAVQPTTLRVKGVVRDAAGHPVGGADVGASTDGAIASSGTSGGDGSFTLLLALDDQHVAGSVAVSAALPTSLGQLTAHAAVPYAAAPHSLLELTAPLQLDGTPPDGEPLARLELKGAVLNALAIASV